MKKLYVSLSCLLMAGAMHAQNFNVTFRVDMNAQTVGANGVHVAGSFQSEAGVATGDWQPGATALADADLDGVYTVTVSIPAGTYEFKFINGNDWPGEESIPENCGVPNGFGGFNRSVTIAGDSVLGAIKFSTCTVSVASSIAKDLNSLRAVKFLPNPMTAAGVLEFSNDRGLAYTFTLTDLQGREVRRISDIRTDRVEVARGDLPAGLYFANLTNEAGETLGVKVMIQ